MKEKLKLDDLKVQSFITSLEQEQMEGIKGGTIVKGRRYVSRSRWTSVDTRVNQDAINPGQSSGG